MVLIWIGVAVFAAAAAFWDRIRQWATDTLADAIERLLGETAKQVFLQMVVAADNVLSAVRRAARRAWHTVCEAILRTLVSVQRKTKSRFIKKLVAYMQKVVDGQKKLFRVVVEEEIPFEDLPDEVRERFILGEEEQVLSLEHAPDGAALGN